MSGPVPPDRRRYDRRTREGKRAAAEIPPATPYQRLRRQRSASMTGATVALVLAAGMFVFLPAAPASATHNCVTEREYRAVHRGMLKRRVHRIFDTNGHLQGRWRYGPIRQYRICGIPNGEVQVTYRRNWDISGPPYRLMSKAAYTK